MRRGCSKGHSGLALKGKSSSGSERHFGWPGIRSLRTCCVRRWCPAMPALDDGSLGRGRPGGRGTHRPVRLRHCRAAGVVDSGVVIDALRLIVGTARRHLPRRAVLPTGPVDTATALQEQRSD